MIKKLLQREYLKGYGDMTAEERKAFDGRVGEWLVKDGTRLLAMTDRPMAKSQNLTTLTTRWTAEDCRALSEGILLMSALVQVADTWLPSNIYMRSAYRAVRQVVSVLSEVKSEELRVKNLLPPSKTTARNTSGRGKATGRRPEAGNAAAPYNHEPKRAAGAGAGNPQALPSTAAANRNMKNTEVTGKVGSGVAENPDPSNSVASVNINPGAGLTPVRPKHIDQYVHLLPKATQERAAKYGELMKELDLAREAERKVMVDPHASAEVREMWAKKIQGIDTKVGNIKKELNREWDKVAATGRVVIDDLGMAHILPDGTVSGDKVQGSSEPAELTAEQRQRRRALRKLLTDVRRGNGKTRDEHLQKWHTMWAEYITLEPIDVALKDEKILAAIKHYGLNIEELK